MNQVDKIQLYYEFHLKMHIEFRHLRPIKEFEESGGLAKAADMLNITQSALSHQIKGLEDQVGLNYSCGPQN